MRLIRERLAGGGDPLAVARWIRDDRRPVILTGRWDGLGTLLTSHPVRVPAAGDDPFELLDRVPSVDGFYGASSMERLPTEIAIAQQVREFVGLKLHSTQ